MLRKIFFIGLLLLFNANCICAKNLIYITPVKKFTTCHKYLFEGDEVKFKITKPYKNFKVGDILTGTVLMYEENGFYGKEAKVQIGNFVTEKGVPIKGNIYLSGSEHPTYTQFAEKIFWTGSFLIRGGEIQLIPDKDVVTFFTE